MVEVGDAAPEFCLPASASREVCLESFQGQWLVLYFYPRDNTSGCTREAVDFTAALPALREMGAEVVGISRDSPASHGKFAEKHSLQVLLLSDQDHKVTEAYGAWALKKMYGKRELWRGEIHLPHQSPRADCPRLAEGQGRRTCGYSEKDPARAAEQGRREELKY